MYHAMLMGGRQGTRNLDTEREQLLQAERPIVPEVLHVVAELIQIHDDAGAVVRGEPARKHRDDVGVPREQTHRAALLLEPRHRIVVGKTPIEDLDRHAPVEVDLVRLVHAAEGATADLSQIAVSGHTRHTIAHHVPLT